MEMPLSLAEVRGACCSGLRCSISTAQRLTAVVWGRGGLAAGSWGLGVPLDGPCSPLVPTSLQQTALSSCAPQKARLGSPELMVGGPGL